MSSRIAVFNEGVVQQYASPDDLYERPADAFVANFIGENNLISATLSKGAGTDTVGAALQCGTPLQARNGNCGASDVQRSEEHTSELQSLMRISYAVFCLNKKT